MGAKRPLNGIKKVIRQTNTHTDRRTVRRTFRLIESIGPEGRCFEKTCETTDRRQWVVGKVGNRGKGEWWENGKIQRKTSKHAKKGEGEKRTNGRG